MNLSRLCVKSILSGLVGLIAAGSAQAQRDVLLNVCNDAGFSVAVAVAYRTNPTEDRTLRSWFLVELVWRVRSTMLSGRISMCT